MELDDYAARAARFGPLQLWTVAFDRNRFKGEILPELERLKLAGVVRIVDLLFVRKDSTGAVATLTASDLEWEEATDFGSIVGALIGWGVGGAEGAAFGALVGAAELADGHAFDEHDRTALLDAVPNDSSAAIALVEHVWAKPLRDAIRRAGGLEVGNDWVRVDDLVGFGVGAAVLSDERRRAAGNEPHA